MVKCNRGLTAHEMVELEHLVVIQSTTDAFYNTKLHIDGNYAVLDVDIDEDGNIEVL